MPDSGSVSAQDGPMLLSSCRSDSSLSGWRGSTGRWQSSSTIPHPPCSQCTLGKLAVGIRVTRPDGSRIGWAEAWKRSSVDLVFASVILVVQVWALTQVDPERYASLRWIERTQLLTQHFPAWYPFLNTLQQGWIWSEDVVVLFNRRKRALHDFIAGTVVIRKEFARERHGTLSPEGELSEEESF
jgi:uncharacterized RDD family membrane protein YckC